MNNQKELDYIMADGELARTFISYVLKISIKDKDKIYYTDYKNLYSINNIIYIYFNIGVKMKSGIYDAIKYYYEFLSKSKDKFEFFYVSFNTDNMEFIIQVKDRNTKEILIDNFNIICIPFPKNIEA